MFIENKNQIEAKIFDGNLLEEEEILSFIQIESLELVSTFGEDTIFRVFGGPVPRAIFLFLNKEENNEEVISFFEKAAEYNYNEGNKLLVCLIFRAFQREDNIPKILCWRRRILGFRDDVLD